MSLDSPTLPVLVVWEKVTGNRMIERGDAGDEKDGLD